MRKKQRVRNTEPDGTSVHPVGRERFISVQKYTGDFPSGETTDWFPQSDEYEPCAFLLGTNDIAPREDR